MHKLKKIIAHPVFLTLISCFIIIQTGYAVPSPSPTPTPAPTDPGTVDRFTGTISGRVYDADTGNPLAGVTVTLTPNTYTHGAVDCTTTTDAQGRYSVSGMKCYYTIDGTWSTLTWLSYVVSVSASGYQDYKSQALTFGKGYYSINQDIALKPQELLYGTITGVVIDAQSRKPLANVHLSIKSYADGLYRGEHSVFTDAEGCFYAFVPRYVDSTLGPRIWLRYTVDLSWQEEGYVNHTSKELVFSEGVTHLDGSIIVTPSKLGTFSGQVIDADTKQPIANIPVLLKPNPLNFYPNTDFLTYTDSQGYYKIENIPRYVKSSTGGVVWLRYSVSIGSYVYLLVFSPFVYDVVEDVQLKREPDLFYGTIAGTVVDAQSKKPLANVSGYIKVHPPAGEYSPFPLAPTNFHFTTDAQGRFRETLVYRYVYAWGGAKIWLSYRVEIDLEGYSPYISPEVTFSETVSSITQDILLESDLNNRTGTIFGKVINSITNQPVEAGVQVFIQAANYQGSPGERPSYSARTDAQGNYKITGVKRFYSPSTSNGQVSVIYIEYEIFIFWENKWTEDEKLVFSDQAFEIEHDISVPPTQSSERRQDVYLDTSQDGTTQFTKPQIICDDTGYVVAVWQTQVDSPQSTGHLRSRASLDCGLNWEATQEVVSSDMAAARIDDARLGQDEKGNVYLSWRMTKGSHQYLYVSRSLNHGYNWTDDRLIKDTAFLPGKERTVFQTGAPVSSKSPAIHLKCQDNTGRVYILETENKEDVELGGLLLAYSLDRGETWNEIGLGRVSDLQDLAMTCDNNGNVYLVGIRSASIAGQDTVSQNAVVFKALSFRQE